MSSINGFLINNTPTTAWLTRNRHYPEGDAALQLTFEQPADDINVIKGVWIQMGADGFLIDGNVDDVADKLGGCCGDDAVVTQNYAAGLPPYQAPVLKTYTLVRLDDGTLAAANQAELDYSGNPSGNVQPGAVPFSFVSRNSGAGTTTYTFQAYENPSPMGTDTITETALVYTSNVYNTALSGSNVYILTGEVDGDTFSKKGSTSIASLVTALNTDTLLGTYGTWSASGNSIVLTTTAKQFAMLVLGQSAP